MLQLEQLHKPLNIAQRAAAEFEMTCRIGRLRKSLGFYSRLYSLHFTHVLRRDCQRITHAVSESLEVGEQRLIARYATRTQDCLLYTSPSPRDGLLSRMPS